MECSDRLTLVSIVDLVRSAELREHFFRDGVVQDEGPEGEGLGCVGRDLLLSLLTSRACLMGE